jgi:cobyrinic acid a,c-diamide synthase
MTSGEYVRELCTRKTAEADIALVEGVMGMYDGASPASIEGSTAEIARWLDLPVLLVVNAHGAARSLAATVQGFAQFEPAVRVEGVIANQGGSDRHRQWLAESLRAANAAPLVGMMPQGALPTLPSRHLGLVTADDEILSISILDQLADACEKHLDISAIIEMASNGGPVGQSGSGTSISSTTLNTARILGKDSIARAGQESHPKKIKLRLGIAQDAAFQFYYADNLESLSKAGAELVLFSPLADSNLPLDLDAIYFGGGYPELYAAQLSKNVSMLDSVRRHAAEGKAIYAECGGMMYLGRSLLALDGVRYPLCEILPIETKMHERLKALGYVEVTLLEDSLFGMGGEALRGHEFHYSELISPLPVDSGWREVYSMTRRYGDPAGTEGFGKGNILASYVHLYFASNPRAIEAFLANCRRQP